MSRRASTQFFRASAGAVICDGNGRVLAFERSEIPGAWQLPQGGIEAGEEPLDTVRREIAEETGIAHESLKLLREHSEWLAYELPAEHRSEKTGRGQVQRWFLFRYEGDPDAVSLPKKGEFRAWRWMSLAAVRDGAVAFRRPIYARLMTEFAELV